MGCVQSDNTSKVSQLTPRSAFVKNQYHSLTLAEIISIKIINETNIIQMLQFVDKKIILEESKHIFMEYCANNNLVEALCMFVCNFFKPNVIDITKYIQILFSTDNPLYYNRKLILDLDRLLMSQTIDLHCFGIGNEFGMFNQSSCTGLFDIYIYKYNIDSILLTHIIAASKYNRYVINYYTIIYRMLYSKKLLDKDTIINIINIVIDDYKLLPIPNKHEDEYVDIIVNKIISTFTREEIFYYFEKFVTGKCSPGSETRLRIYGNLYL
jgi:hypothetical protein